MQKFGEKLRRLRVKHNLTTRQLADQLGTDNIQISRIETGQRQPSGDLLVKIADFFEVSLDYLMRDDWEVE